MPRSLRLAYLAHAISSDWGNPDAHFLRGLLRALTGDGHEIVAWELSDGWSVEHLMAEPHGEESLRQFRSVYPDIDVRAYVGSLAMDDTEGGKADELWAPQLRNLDVVILHAWHPPALADRLLRLRERCGYKLLFHDTGHHSPSWPEEADALQIGRFDGAIVASGALRRLYRERSGLERVWLLPPAADTTVFHPHHEVQRTARIVWPANWNPGTADAARLSQIDDYLLEVASALVPRASVTIYGVDYPPELARSANAAGVACAGYLPNLSIPMLYASAAATVHLPRVSATVPTTRLFEALACGLPLVTAPWDDEDGLLRPGDLIEADSPAAMTARLRRLIDDPSAAEAQALHGMETVLTRHTSHHRAHEFAEICEEALQA